MKNTGRLVKIASNHITKKFDQFAHQFGLTWNQMSLIDYLSRRQLCTQSDIQREFFIQRSTATVMIQRMEKKGLVKRTVSPTDARQRVVTLTAQAKPLVSEIEHFMIQQQVSLEKHFSATEIQQFEQMLIFLINED